MIDLLLKVTLLLALALAIQPLLGRASAAARHLVCAYACAGTLLLPLTLLVPMEPSAVRIGTSALLSVARALPQPDARWTSATVLTTFWALGSALLIARIAIGCLAFSRLVRDATPFETTEDASVYLADVSVPVVSGLLRPVILLPRCAESWTNLHRTLALEHEMEHIRRKDLWTMLVGHLACAAFWFHPLIWIVARRSRREQEFACDDAVLSAGFEPASYAEALVAAVRDLTSSRLIGCHMLTRKTLESRIARLFDTRLARIPSPSGLRGTAVTSMAAIVLVATLIGIRPANADDKIYGYRVGGDVSEPEVIRVVDPEYSEQARKLKLSGPVRVTIIVDKEGRAQNIRIIRSLGMGLDENAVAALRKWKFRPGMKDGKPVNVRATIEINFRLL